MILYKPSPEGMRPAAFENTMKKKSNRYPASHNRKEFLHKIAFPFARLGLATYVSEAFQFGKIGSMRLFR